MNEEERKELESVKILALQNSESIVSATKCIEDLRADCNKLIQNQTTLRFAILLVMAAWIIKICA